MKEEKNKINLKNGWVIIKINTKQKALYETSSITLKAKHKLSLSEILIFYFTAVFFKYQGTVKFGKCT